MKTVLIALASSSLLAGAATAETQSYNVKDFDKISVATGIKADVTVGPTYSVVADSSVEGLERLEVKVKNGELQLRRVSKGMRWKRGDNVTVNITLPALTGLDGSSGASVDATGIDAASFAIDASSGAHIDASGTCDRLSIDISSGAHVDAGELQCRSVLADASSGADGNVYATEEVNGDASSGGMIKVRGNPERVSKDTSSGGNISVARAN
jgi:hypothetical protein